MYSIAKIGSHKCVKGEQLLIMWEHGWEKCSLLTMALTQAHPHKWLCVDETEGVPLCVCAVA